MLLKSALSYFPSYFLYNHLFILPNKLLLLNFNHKIRTLDTFLTINMGKRKQRVKKPKAPLAPRKHATKDFDCLFCSKNLTVTVKLDQKAAVGDLSCSACGQSFQTPINYLSEAVDVYSDWVDACHAVAKEAAKAMGPLPTLLPKTGGRRVPAAPKRDTGTGLFDDDDDDEEDEDPIRMFERFDRLKSARSVARKARGDKSSTAKSTDEVAAGSSSSQPGAAQMV